MVRISKKMQRRHISPRKRRPIDPSLKTGPKKDVLSKGYREHDNAVEGERSSQVFIGKIG